MIKIKKKYSRKLFLIIFLSILSLSNAEKCDVLLEQRNIFAGSEGIYFYGSSLVKPNLYITSQETEFDYFIQLLKEIDQKLLIQGTQLVIAPIPPKPIVLAQFLDPESKRQKNFDVKGVEQEYLDFVEIANQNQILVADLLTPLQDYNQSEGLDLVNLANERHWSVIGSQLSALAVAEAIKSTELYRNITINSEIKLKEADYRTTDFNNLIIGHVKRNCGIELSPEVLLQYETIVQEKDEVSLFSNDRTDILLLGTSYNDDVFSFNDFLSFDTQFEVVSYSKNGSGMFSAFQHILSTQQLSQQNPKFLVWEFPFLDMAGREVTTGVHSHILSKLKNINSRLHAVCDWNSFNEILIPINPLSSSASFYLGDFWVGGLDTNLFKYVVINIDPRLTQFQVKNGDAMTFSMAHNPTFPYDGKYFFEFGTDVSLSQQIHIEIHQSFEISDGEFIQIGICQ